MLISRGKFLLFNSTPLLSSDRLTVEDVELVRLGCRGALLVEVEFEWLLVPLDWYLDLY